MVQTIAIFLVPEKYVLAIGVLCISKRFLFFQSLYHVAVDRQCSTFLVFCVGIFQDDQTVFQINL